jgi:sulfate adenylyltransferase subunit 2
VFIRDGVILADAPFMMKRDTEKVVKMRIRCRTIGDISCTGLAKSEASTLEDIIQEIAAIRVTERGSRADDLRSESAMEDRKKEGYF